MHYASARGFTLVELLLVVLVIGIIAALVLVRFNDVKEESYKNAMLNDLRNFAVAAEVHHDAAAAYPADPETLPGFALTEKVEVLDYSASADAWELILAHAQTDITCDLSGGASASAMSARPQCAEFRIAVSDETPAAGDAVTFDASDAVEAFARADLPGTPLFAADLGDLSRIDWDFGDGTSEGGTPAGYVVVEHVFAEPGEYLVVLTLTGADGEAKLGRRQITVGATGNRAPVANFEWTPVTGEAGAEISFSSLSMDPDSDPLTLAWDFAGLGTSTDENPTFSFPTEGTYSVSLVVTDPSLATDQIARNVVIEAANLPPTAGFTVNPAEPVAGGTAQFIDTSTDADGDIVSWAWDFGESGVDASTEPGLTVTFPSAGTFSVTLSVTDDAGDSDEMVQEITVADAGPAFSVMVAGGSTGTAQIATSEDGTNFTTVATPFDVGKYASASVYSDGMFVAAGYNEFATSTDGAEWTTIPHALGSGYVNELLYNGSQWLALTTSKQATSSTDLSTWTPAATPLANFVGDLRGAWLASEARWIVGGLGGRGIAYSEDGSTWSAASHPFQSGYYVEDVSCSASECLAVGRYNTYANGGLVAYSTDGANWTGILQAPDVALKTFFAVYEHNGTWYVGAIDALSNRFILVSSDLTNWTKVYLPAQSVAPKDLTFVGGRFYAWQNCYAGGWTSADGLTWTTLSTPFPPCHFLGVP